MPVPEPSVRLPSPDRPGTVVTDFDGTLTRADVGHELFLRFAGPAASEVVALWKRGEIGSRECLIRECAAARVTPEALRAFARAQPIDPGFAPFVTAARALGWRVLVASDGLDLYIRIILAAHGLRIPMRTNRGRLVAGRIVPSFPHAGRGCGRCGNCKAGAIEDARGRGPVVFVGNGLSDRCAAGVADAVFAKDDLATHCRDAGLPFVAYNSFSDLARTWFGNRTLHGTAV